MEKIKEKYWEEESLKDFALSVTEYELNTEIRPSGILDLEQRGECPMHCSIPESCYDLRGCYSQAPNNCPLHLFQELRSI